MNERVELVPVRLAGGFQVIKLGGNCCFAGNRDQLVRRLQQARSFAADVRDVHAAVFGGDFRQRDQLFCFRVKGRRVDQRGTDAERSFLHGPAHQHLHPLQFFGCRRTVGVTDFVNPHGGGADERGDIAGNTVLNEEIEIFAERRPSDFEFDVALLFSHLFFHRVAERAHRFAFTHDLERDALADIALGTAILDERFVRPTEHVDETGRNRETPGVDFSFAARVRQFADGRDGIPADRHSAGERRRAAAVVNRPVADDEVVVCRCRPWR